MTATLSLRAAYVGSFGYHGFVSVDPNDIPAQICASATAAFPEGRRQPSRAAWSQGAQYIPVSARPNPYLGPGFFWYTEGNTSYNALQIDVTHRLAHGLQFRANYTRSKNLDVNSALTIAQANNQPQMVMDRNNLKRDWGPSALNAENQASISSLYALPGRGRLAGRMAAERDRDAAERVSVHAADRGEPVGRWRHAES